MTEHFISTLPPLLDKYAADSEKLANLLTIPQFFELDLYTSGRQESSLNMLLAKLKHIAQIHHEQEVLLNKLKFAAHKNFWHLFNLNFMLKY